MVKTERKQSGVLSVDSTVSAENNSLERKVIK